MSDEIRIRTALPEDVVGTRTLLVETWHDTYDRLFGEARVTEITNSWHAIDSLVRQLGVPQTSFLVAARGEVIVGHVLADARRSPVLTITRLYVHPTHQRRGLGRRLLEAAIAGHPHCDQVTLEVAADNEKAVAFYRAEGFEAVRRTKSEGIDHLEMVKRTRSSGDPEP